jgi:indole-3-glycerol phosphate synthase
LLEALYAGALEDASSRAESISTKQLESAIDSGKPAIDALAAFAPRKNIHVLAEIKRASPSKGSLAEISDPKSLARTYVNNGATGISVLTEGRRFKGSLQDFDEVRSEVYVPLLRKDFLATEYQLLEARAHGADIALLIVAGLEQRVLRRLYDFTIQLGMTPFIETHSANELAIALELDAKFVGVNARDLSTFETDRHLFESLVHMFPSDVIKVAESAVRTVEDVQHYRNSGADVVLVGEALVTGDPAKQLKQFLEVE